MVLATVMVLKLADGAVRYGLFGMITDWEFWMGIGTALVNLILSIGLICACAKACIMPPSSNRALSVRLWITASIVVGLITAISWDWATSGSDALIGWHLGSILLLSFVMLGCVSERDHTGARLTRSIPRGPIRRVMAFFFYSGAAGGILWCGGLMLLVTIITALGYLGGLGSRAITRSNGGEVVEVMIGIGLYVTCYCLTAALLRRKLLWRLVHSKLTWAVALIIFGIMMAIPLLSMLRGLYQPSFRMEDNLELFAFTPVVLFENKTRAMGLTLASIWLICIFLASLPWIIRQIRGFRPPAPMAIVRPNPEPPSTETGPPPAGDMQIPLSPRLGGEGQSEGE